MSQLWDGTYMDGQSARILPAKVRITPMSLLVMLPDKRTLQWPYAEIRRPQGGHRNEHVRLERGDVETPEVVVIRDPAFLDALQAGVPQAKLGVQVVGSAFAMRVMMAAIAAVGASAGLYVWGIPALASVVTQQVPVRWEEKLGETVRDQLAPVEVRCTHPATQRAVEAIVAVLTEGSHSPYTYRVVISKEQTVNAFAAPGGYVVVNAGLLKKTKTAGELAGVLAHELQHVEKRHATRGLLRQASFQILLSAATGDAGQIGTLLGIAGKFGSSRYQRTDETEADRAGMLMLQRAHLDPQQMVAAFQMLDAETSIKNKSLERGLSYMSSHPLTMDRIRMLQSMAKSATYTPIPLLPQVDWARLVKTTCQ